MKRNNSGLNQIIVKNYCDHFQSIQSSKVPPIKKLICNVCKCAPPNTWICLTKGCGTVVCGKNKYKHMLEHNQQTKYKHPIFINSTTTEIRCTSCNIQILDFDQLQYEQFESIKDKVDPLLIRRRFTKKQSQNALFKNGGNIENSAAHKKTSKGLCGLLSKNGETSISSVVQFFSNIKFLKDVLKVLKVVSTDDNSRLLSELISIMSKIWSGDVRIISIHQFENIVIKCLNSYKGYSKKNPLQLFTLIFNIIHDAVKFTYHIPQGEKQPEEVPDQWQTLTNDPNQYSALKTNLCSNIVYKLKCSQCNVFKEIQGQIFKMELQIPKIRKQSKVLESEFEKHKFESPLKNRRKSLVQRFFKKQIEIPITLVQLVINYIKNRFPSNKQLKTCQKCNKQMIGVETKFTKLPNLLIIIIYNHQKDPTQIVERPNILDMKGFVEQSYDGQTQYEFQAAICERQNQFVTLVRTKHLYEFMNQYVKLTNQTIAPYILCYALKNRYVGLYHNVKSNVKIQISPQYLLPDLWLQQLKHFQPYSLVNPLICKHSKLKPVQSRINRNNYVPKQIYIALIQKFGGRMYLNQKCFSCSCELHSLNLRKRKQKQYISKLDSYRCKLYCMIACIWLDRWTNYLYKKKEEYYLLKGYPEPGPIDNGPLWDGSKFKQDLKKGEDFKLVNFYVWTFFKELYGGGPQIQYKNKVEDKRKGEVCDPQVLKQIRQKVKQLKQYMRQKYYMTREWVESPIKKRQGRQQSIKQFNSSQKQ